MMKQTGWIVVSLAMLLSAAWGAKDSKAKEGVFRYDKADHPVKAEEEFTSLFNGKDFSGWIGNTKGYEVKDGAISCLTGKGKGGNIFHEKEYDNFVLRFEFKLTPGANNGLALRAPRQGNPAHTAIECQVLDNTAEKNAKLQPGQYHGSLYKFAPAKRGFLKPMGEWNSQEVIADGEIITVILNGTTIVDHYDVSARKKPKKGLIGFLGHGSRVDFRNIRIKELASNPEPKAETCKAEKANAGDNTAPEGYTALFDGKSLKNWKGLLKKPHDKPHGRKDLAPEKLAELQKAADKNMNAHWQVENGVIVFDGKGASLCTAKQYGDFELYVDWKISKGGDSGIYIRGLPQVQIWDHAEGSGALWNNKKAGRKPLVAADNPVGEWNRFHIKMVGDNVTVKLNGKLVVDNAALENLWQKGQPIPKQEQIELQSHNSPLWFKNVYIKEL